VYLTFSEQNNAKLTVKIDYTEDSDKGVGQGNGIGAFITGEGNKFSIFVAIEYKIGSYTCETVEVYSGEIEENGIRNCQNVLIMVDDHGDPGNQWIGNGQGRLFKDGDGFSEKIGTGLKSSHTSKSGLPSMISSEGLNY
jgi:hypothetical protein